MNLKYQLPFRLPTRMSLYFAQPLLCSIAHVHTVTLFRHRCDAVLLPLLIGAVAVRRRRYSQIHTDTACRYALIQRPITILIDTQGLGLSPKAEHEKGNNRSTQERFSKTAHSGQNNVLED